MIKGYLKYFVLKYLDAHEMTGYDLMKHLEVSTGKKPSPGSMYPLLKDLEENRYIKSREKGRRKIYSITKQGKEVLKRFKKEKQVMFEKINKSMSALVELFGSTEQEFLNKVAKAKNSDSFLKVGSKELVEFKMALFNLVAEGKYDHNESQIKKILKETTQRLKRLK